MELTVTITPELDANAAGELILSYINDRGRWGYATHEFLRGDFFRRHEVPPLDARTVCCGYLANDPSEYGRIQWWSSYSLGIDLFLYWDGDGTIVVRHDHWTLENSDCKKSYGWEWVGPDHWSRNLPDGYYDSVSDEHAKREDPKGLSPKDAGAACEAGDAHE